jgi:uncharacterized protein involved in tellurium resistance
MNGDELSATMGIVSKHYNIHIYRHRYPHIYIYTYIYACTHTYIWIDKIFFTVHFPENLILKWNYFMTYEMFALKLSAFYSVHVKIVNLKLLESVLV